MIVQQLTDSTTDVILRVPISLLQRLKQFPDITIQQESQWVKLRNEALYATEHYANSDDLFKDVLGAHRNQDE
jgi:hypothetical protein